MKIRNSNAYITLEYENMKGIINDLTRKNIK